MSEQLLAAVLGFGSALIGAWAGAISSHAYARRQQRLQLALALAEQFNAPEMLRSRIKADRLLRDNLSLSTPKTFGQLYAELPAEDWEHISRVRHFFAHLAMLKRTDSLDIQLAKQLFGQHIHAWFNDCFLKLEAIEPAKGSWKGTSDELACWAQDRVE